MDSLEDILNSFVQEVEDNTINLPIEDKAKITKAGAEIFKAELETVTRDKHYRERKTGKKPHLADSVLIDNKNIDNIKDGSSVVGWDYSQSRVGHLIENGTKYPMFTKRGYKYKHAGEVHVHADHFVRDLRESPDVQAKMLEAESQEYAKILRKRSGN